MNRTRAAPGAASSLRSARTPAPVFRQDQGVHRQRRIHRRLPDHGDLPAPLRGDQSQRGQQRFQRISRPHGPVDDIALHRTTHGADLEIAGSQSPPLQHCSDQIRACRRPVARSTNARSATRRRRPTLRLGPEMPATAARPNTRRPRRPTSVRHRPPTQDCSRAPHSAPAPPAAPVSASDRHARRSRTAAGRSLCFLDPETGSAHCRPGPPPAQPNSVSRIGFIPGIQAVGATLRTPAGRSWCE